MRGAIAAMMLVMTMSACRWVRTGAAGELSPVRPAAPKRVALCGASACRDSLDLIALGVSGYLFMGWRDTTRLLMTPPAFRHPSIWRLGPLDFLLGTRPDTARIARRLAAMPAASTERLQRVSDILVGHGHYDHLMDLPPMAARLPNARVHGSMTVVNLLAGAPAWRDRLVNVDATAAYDTAAMGAWTAAPPWRFKPIAWQHARNFPGVTYAPGDIWKPATGLPRTAAGWKMGRVYAFALDLIADDGSVACRLLAHDAAASPRVVARASAVWAREAPARATVAIISAANFDRVDSYPDSLLTLTRPSHVVLGHWEDFFRSPEKEWRRVRGIVGKDLIRRVEQRVDTNWSALEPGATLRIVC